MSKKRLPPYEPTPEKFEYYAFEPAIIDISIDTEPVIAAFDDLAKMMTKFSFDLKSSALYLDENKKYTVKDVS